MSRGRRLGSSIVASAALILLVIGCNGQPATSASPSEAASATSASPSEAASATSPPGESVVCEWFAAGGPRQKFIEAFAESITPGADYQTTLRTAIIATRDLGDRASGEEQDDLLALAAATYRADLAGDTHAWRLLVDEFYVKYVEQCGAPLS